MTQSNPARLNKRLRSALFLAAAITMPCAPLLAQPAPPADPAAAPAPGGQSEQAKLEYKANDMLNKGLELLELKQDERAVKMIASVPQMFPKAKARFKAFLTLGSYYAQQGQHELAIKQFSYLAESENPDEQAEGLYQTGICYYNLGNFDKAFMSLRRVTSDFPWSVFANESYFYIGQCHFKLGRWVKAVEALEMVGTSVDPDAQGVAVAEAGQRLYVKVFDKDLIVLRTNNLRILATLTTLGGDKEQVTLEPLGRTGEYYIASVVTVPAEPKPGDGILQIKGGDVVTINYLDTNTESGTLNQERSVKVKLVSSASVGFTDGAYREYTKGVFGDQDCFLRVRDLDADLSPDRDVIRVKVYAEYKVEKPLISADPAAGPAVKGIDLTDQPETAKRQPVEVVLKETEAHSGVFVGKVVPTVAPDAPSATSLEGAPARAAAPAAAPAAIAATAGGKGSSLLVRKGDDLVMEYLDNDHLNSPDPATVRYAAKLLIGQIQDVKVEHRVVDSLDLKSRKNLIEGKIFLKLGSIFKEVGLAQKASEKAEEGLDRVEDVIGTSLKANLDRSLVEEAFSIKWDLLLVQDKLNAAIDVCRALTQLFPDSTLVDRALLKIGQARAESDRPSDAISIFSAVTQLPKSELKAEAQFNIGLVMEKIATAEGERTQRPPVLTGAMLAYKQCAELYPTSPFAGESLDHIANYYISAKDYTRAVELMEQVFQDYPDASFLDKMLLKYVVAAYRMGNIPLAKEKAEQLISEYPNSKWAETARGYLTAIQKKAAG